MESPLDEKALLAFLDMLDIPYTLYRHSPVFTVEEAKAARSGMPRGTGHGHSKNLFVRDKKKNHALVIAQETTPIDLKTLATTAGMGRLSFASADRLARYLGVTPGSVTPFAMLHAMQNPADDQPHIQVILDRNLMGYDVVYFHPLHNSATVSLTPDDLLRFLHACEIEPQVLDL